MMTKTTSKKMVWCRGVALIPVFFAAICIFSNCDSSNTTTSTDATTDKIETRAITEQQSDILKSDVFDIVEEMPEFPGGISELNQFLNTNIKYPELALEHGIQGLIIVRAIVDRDGTIKNPEVLHDTDPLLDAEAVRVISLMPKWTPGKYGGIAVAVYINIPVLFSLQELRHSFIEVYQSRVRE